MHYGGRVSRRPSPSDAPVPPPSGRRAIRALAVATALIAAAAPAARADSEWGPRIAAGTSAGGQAWSIRASVAGPRMLVSTFLPLDGGDGGAMRSFPWHTPEPLDVGAGSGFGTNADEWEIDGVVSRAVVRLTVTTSDGATETFRPRRAPRAAVRRFPPLARFRYFARFFPTAREPLVVTALGRGGRVLATQDLR